MSVAHHLFCLILLLCTTASGYAQRYTSVVVFGDSLSDTGNFTSLTYAKYHALIPGPAADYTIGRFTDGSDTFPPALNYRGVWVEQLAAMLPTQPGVTNSLSGGKDYAYGFATNNLGTGAFTFGTDDPLSVNVNNVSLQVTDYLRTHPRIDNKTLFVVWGGAIDVLYATSQQSIIDAALQQAVSVERLMLAGATQIVVPNLPPLGLVPRLNGSPATSIPGTQASALYNQVLSGTLDIVQALAFGRSIHLYRLDVFSLFQAVIASPASYGLANVTGSSQGLPVNPDTYLFWDDLHPTTHGHDILALAALKLVDPQTCMQMSGPGYVPSCEALP